MALKKEFRLVAPALQSSMQVSDKITDIEEVILNRVQC